MDLIDYLNAICLFIFLVVLGYIIAHYLYKMWFNSHLVTLKEDNNSNLKTSESVKDKIIFEYTLGGYMDMISLSIPVLTMNYEIYGGNSRMVFGDGDVEEVKNRIFYIGYEIKANSGKFFVYSKIRAKDGEIRFSTFLGENPCRFIVFTTDSNMAFVPDNKKIQIIEDTFDIDYVFDAMPWQKLGDKKFSRVLVEEANKLVPYEEYFKWHPLGVSEGFNQGNMPSPLP